MLRLIRFFIVLWDIQKPKYNEKHQVKVKHQMRYSN